MKYTNDMALIKTSNVARVFDESKSVLDRPTKFLIRYESKIILIFFLFYQFSIFSM